MIHEESLPTGSDADASAHAPERSTGAFAEAIRTSREGKFSVACRFERAVSYRSHANFGLRGRGEISIADGVVTIRGRRSFWKFRRKARHAFDQQRLCAVQRSGRHVYLIIAEDDQGTRRQRILAKARSIQDAQHLVKMLPPTEPPPAGDANAELLQYRGNLELIGELPLITPALILINAIVFVAMCFAGLGFLHPNPARLIAWGTNFGPFTVDGQWWRMLTSMFVHFGFKHIAMNMIVLAFIGPTIERIFGHFRYATIYLLAGLAGSMTSLLVHPSLNSMGASGAIFGIVGAFLAFVIRRRNGVPPSVTQRLIVWIVLFMGMNLQAGFTHASIDNAAHIGGLLGGFALGLLMYRPLTVQARANRALRPALLRAAVGLCGLGILAVPVLHPPAARRAHLAFEETLQRIGPLEIEAAWASQRLSAMSPLNREGMEELSVACRTQVVPKWLLLVQKTTAQHLDPSDSDYALQQTLAHYYRDRAKAFQLTADAYHDEAMDRLDESRFEAQLKAVETDAIATKKHLHELTEARKKARE